MIIIELLVDLWTADEVVQRQCHGDERAVKIGGNGCRR
jgi:hypothetical protein